MKFVRRVTLRALAVLTAAGLGLAALLVYGNDLPIVATESLQSIPPRVVASPTITGDGRLGGTVSCTRARWDDGPARRYAVTYRWRRDNQDIAGATERSHRVAIGELNHQLSCVATAHSEDGTTDASASIFPSPRGRIAPSLTGDARLDGTLTCGRGGWDERADSPYPVAYRWLRDSSVIAGSVGPTRVVTRADLGAALYCEVTAANVTAQTSQTIAIYPRAVSAPALSGDPRVGGTLSCGRGTWDEPPSNPYSVTYAWYRNESLVPGATGSSYVVGLVDVGRGLRCSVRAEGVTVAPSVTVGIYPQNRSVPVIDGDPRMGGTLTCSRGFWDERADSPQYDTAYRWLRDGTPIADEFTTSYDVTRADLGHSVACRVSIAGLASADSLTLRPTAVLRLAPSLGGDPRLGGTLTCGRGTWDERPDAVYQVTYQWTRDGQYRSETATTHTVTRDDLGHRLGCIVTAEGVAVGYSSDVSVDTHGRVAPALTGAPIAGATLSCTRGFWDERADTPYDIRIEWRRDFGTVIPEATVATYTTGAADADHYISCAAVAENRTMQQSNYVVIRAAAPTPGSAPQNLSPPVIDGDMRVGHDATCSRGEWDDSSEHRYAIALRWYRDTTGSDPVDLGATHTVQRADLGHTLYCLGEAPQGVTALTAISVPLPQNISVPKVTGDPRVGRTLTCSRGVWNDDPATPYTLSFRWYSDYPYGAGSPGPIDTQADHVVGAADAGRLLYCLVEAEGATTVLVTASVPAAAVLVAPQISGDPRPGGELTCSRGTWDDEPTDRYAVTYHWYRDYPYAGTASPSIDSTASHAIVPQDLGRQLYCLVSAPGNAGAIATFYVPSPRNVVAPQISGDPHVGHTLTCTRGEWDEQSGHEYSVVLQWYREYPFINSPQPLDPGATHVVQTADLGHSLWCLAEIAGGGQALNGVAVAAPVANIQPKILQDPRPGVPATCTRGDWDDEASARYPVEWAWYRDYPYDPANRLGSGDSYTPTSADVGHSLICSVVAAGLSTALSQAQYVRPPELLRAPTITGDSWLGGRLSCSRGDWDDEAGARYPVTYRWYRDAYSYSPQEDRRIPGATTDHHVVVPEDLGHYVQCVVEAAGAAIGVAQTFPSDAPGSVMSTVDDDQPLPGATLTVTLTVSNPGQSLLRVYYLRYTPFAAASYHATSSTGASSAEPSNDGSELRWYVGVDLEAGASLEQRFKIDLPAGTADLVDRPWADTDRGVRMNGRSRVSPLPADPVPGACTINGTPGADTLTGTAGPDVICGGEGDDVLIGLEGDDQLFGGDGEDRLEGGDGDDMLRAGRGADTLIAGAGADEVRGGGGRDLVSYGDRDDAVRVTLGAGSADDGAAGEADDVARDVERVRGGHGPDLLIGSDDPNGLEGLGGSDRIVGGGGIDELSGGSGDDRMEAEDANAELVDCGGGLDVVVRDDDDRPVGCETRG